VLGERRESLDVRPPPRDLLIREHEPRERAGDLAVGDAHLEDAAERDQVREVRGRGDDDGDERIRLTDATRQQAQGPLRPHELPPVRDHAPKAVRRFVLLQRHAT
jgi:hypothetical protein